MEARDRSLKLKYRKIVFLDVLSFEALFAFKSENLQEPLEISSKNMNSTHN